MITVSQFSASSTALESHSALREHVSEIYVNSINRQIKRHKANIRVTNRTHRWRPHHRHSGPVHTSASVLFSLSSNLSRLLFTVFRCTCTPPPFPSSSIYTTLLISIRRLSYPCISIISISRGRERQHIRNVTRDTTTTTTTPTNIFTALNGMIIITKSTTETETTHA